MTKAPIALFVFNRPHHTAEVIRHLVSNPDASDSDLYIFSDGPRTNADVIGVKSVRELLRTVSGFRSVTVTERHDNAGLARSIIDGVTRVCGAHGRVIVLEDDIVVSRYFLDYMNRALDRYEDEERVMHVSGYMFPVSSKDGLPETFFYRGTSCWGWATWQRAWRFFVEDGESLLRRIKELRREYDFDIQGTTNYTRMLSWTAAGKLDSWAIRWYASIFLQEGLCLHPRESLTCNIGHDGSGTHCRASDNYHVELASMPVSEFPDEAIESKVAVDAIARFYRSIRSPLYKRMFRAVQRFGRL